MSRFLDAAGRGGLVIVVGLALSLAARGESRSASDRRCFPPCGDAQSSKPQTPAQAPPSQKGQAPVFRAGVNVVRVDIIVTDRQGNAVTDLAQSDFEVLEDGRPQTIDLFRLVNSNGTPGPGAEPARPIRSMYDEEAEAAREDVRLFVIFLDDYHVRLQNSLRIRDTLVQFVTTQLGPLDMVAIMYPLTPVTALSFTRDRNVLVQAIRSFEGRKFDYSPRNAFEREYVFYPPQIIETLRNQVTLSALEGLPVRLGSLREGRKAVILVSEGFVGIQPAQVSGPMAGFPGAAAPPGGSLSDDRAQFQADLDIQRELRDIADTANRNNTAVYALDPRGLAVTEYGINENVDQRQDLNTLRQSQSTLQGLANDTDGRAIVNRNDLAAGLTQVVRDTSSYYLVGYNSSLTTPDGKFHKIDIRLKRPGLQVRARKGYWAPTAEDAARAAAPPKPRPPAAVEQALSAVEGNAPRESVAATWIGTARGEEGRTRMTYVWEPLPPIPGDKRPEPSRVLVVATGSDSQTYFRGRVPAEAPVGAVAGAAAPPDAAPVAGVREPSKISFDVRPGKMQLRTSIENAAGQVIDATEQDLTIPDFSAQKVALSTPLVFCARTVRQMQSLLRDPDPTPTALRQFRRTDRLLIRFSAYAPRLAAPIVTVRLLNRVGQKMSDLGLKAPDAAGEFYSVDLPLSGLSPGEYLIEVMAAGDGGEATQLIAMRVVS